MARYVLTVNVPGFMPEQEPYEMEGWQAALDALKGELETTFDTDARWATEGELVNALAVVDRLYYEHPRYLAIEFGPYVHTLDMA